MDSSQLYTDANQLTWSNEKMSLGYHRSSPLLRSESSKVGLIQVFPDRFGDTRWIHWETDGSVICLREFSLNGFVLDSSICFKTDGCDIIDAFVDCQSNEEYHIVFVASNGDLLQIPAHAANPLTSIFHSLVRDAEGKSLHVGSWSWTRGSEVPVLSGRNVLTATRVGRHTLALGLSKGDAVCVYLGPLAKNGTPKYGALLRDASMLQSLLSSTRLFNTAENNQDTVAVGPIDFHQKGSNGGSSSNSGGLFLAVNAAGYIRVWNSAAEQYVSLTCLNELMQGLNVSDPNNRGFNSTERDTLRLQQAVVRGAVLTSEENEQYLVVAVATLQIETSFNNKPHWQVCTLLARFASARDIGKLHLLGTPLTSQSLTGAFHELSDLQLHSEAGSGVVRLLCSWRSTELDTVLTSTSITVNFGLLREFASSGQMRSDLYSVTSSVIENDVITAHNALIAEDQLLFQHALTPRVGEENTLGEVLKRVELVLLQRIFQTSRYTPVTLTSSLRGFTRRHSELSAAQAAVVEALASQELSFACEHNESFASRAPKVILDLLKQVALYRVLYLNSLGTGNESSNAFINVFLETCAEFLQSCDDECKLLEVGASGSMGAMAVAPGSNKLLIAQRSGKVGLMQLNTAALGETGTIKSGVESILTKVSAVLQNIPMFRLMEASMQQIDQSDKQSVLKLLDEITAQVSAENLPGVTSLLADAQWSEMSEGQLNQLYQHCVECNGLRFTGLEDWSAFTQEGKIQNLADAIVNVLHIYLQRTKLVAVLFTLILKHRRGSVSETGIVRIRDHLLPKTVNQLCYLSLVMWLNVVRPTNNFIAKHNVETTRMMALMLGTSETFTPLDLYLDLPLLANYIHHHMNQLTLGQLLKGSADSVQECWIAVAKDTLTSLNPFTSDDFALFLFQSGQYAVLQIWSLVLETIHSTAVADTTTSASVVGNDCRYPLHKTVQGAPVFQAITSLYPGALRAMASLCESLRCRTSYHQDGTQLDDVLTQDFSSALNRELNNLSAWSKRFNSTDELPASFLLHSLVTTGSDATTPVVNEEQAAEIEDCLQKVSDACDSESQGVISVFFGVLKRLLKKPLFQTFFSQWKGSDDSAQPSRLLSVLHEHSFWLYHIAAVYHLMDLIEVLERTQLILSHREGLNQIIEVSLVLSSVLESLLTAVSEIPVSDDLLSVGQSIFAQSVYQSLHDSWAKVFEYTLLLGEDNCSFALDAVFRLIELEEDPLFCESLIVRSTWRQCLNALINHACDCGQLGWLCSLTDVQLGTAVAGRQALRLVDVIAEELEYLTSDCVAESYAVEKVFYFECLTTFLLVHGRFAEVVRVVDSVTNALEGSTVYGKSEDLVWWQAVAVQALASLPVTEQVVLKQERHGMEYRSDEKSLTLLDKKALEAKFTGRVLGHGTEGTMETSDSAVCSTLCTQGLYNAARTLARRHCDSDHEMVDLVLVQLANDCCVTESSSTLAGGRTVVDQHQSPFVTDVSTAAANNEDLGVLHCATLLKDCLSDLVSRASACTEGVQTTSSSSHHHSLCLLLVALLSANATVAHTFVSDYLTYLSSLTDKLVIAARVSDVLTLIRLCVRDKHFVLACNLVLILLSIGVSSDNGAAFGSSSVVGIIGTPHYNAVDVVLREAESHLASNADDDLKAKVEEVKEKLKDMFRKTVVNSMK